MDPNRDPRGAEDLARAFASIDEHWRPRVAAELNGQELKLVKFQGEFVWHRHADADEMFLVWRGRMRIEYRDRVVTLGAGQFAVVPRGVEHRTAADKRRESGATRVSGWYDARGSPGLQSNARDAVSRASTTSPVLRTPALPKTRTSTS